MVRLRVNGGVEGTPLHDDPVVDAEQGEAVRTYEAEEVWVEGYVEKACKRTRYVIIKKYLVPAYTDYTLTSSGIKSLQIIPLALFSLRPFRLHHECVGRTLGFRIFVLLQSRVVQVERCQDTSVMQRTLSK